LTCAVVTPTPARIFVKQRFDRHIRTLGNIENTLFLHGESHRQYGYVYDSRKLPADRWLHRGENSILMRASLRACCANSSRL
jgi:hypothetical protein